MSRIALVIGFGPVARGYAAPLLQESGLEVIFCLGEDRWKQFTEGKPRVSYCIHRVKSNWKEIRRDARKPFEFTVIPCLEPETSSASGPLLYYGKNCKLIVTAVGSSNFDRIRPLIAQIIQERLKPPTNEDSLNILLLENLTVLADEALVLKAMLALDAGAKSSSYVEQQVGIADTVTETDCVAKSGGFDVMVGGKEEPLYVNGARLKGKLPIPPDFRQIKLVEDIERRRMRKMFIHNFVDTATAYVGARYGHKYIREAIKDPRVYPVVKYAVREIVKALSEEFPDHDEMREEKLIEMDPKIRTSL